MMRLGCAVKILGRPGLKSHDGRRRENKPHLSVSLAYLRDILLYLRQKRIRFYRFSANLAPYLSAADGALFEEQRRESAAELAYIGTMAAGYGIRLTCHAPLSAVLNSRDESVRAHSRAVLNRLSLLFDDMNLGRESVIVLHVGGRYEGQEEALTAFLRSFERLLPGSRRRIALELDTRFDLPALNWLHERSGLPIVYDHLHHLNYNPAGLSTAEALDIALRSWPAGITPKVHFSSPRTSLRLWQRDKQTFVEPPRWTQHADYIDPFAFQRFLAQLPEEASPDVMVEAKATDLALLRLRQDLARFAPDLADRYLERAEGVKEETPVYQVWFPSAGAALERVLVVLLNNRADWRRVQEEKWYRIPVKRAPERVAADYLAFYRAKALAPAAFGVYHYAPVLRYRLRRRRDLLPEEADHPRADDWYYQIFLGECRTLPRPIPSRRLRRVTFIPTTLEKLLTAREINDLWLSDGRQESLWRLLQREGYDVERFYRINERENRYLADFVLFTPGKRIAFFCDEMPTTPAPPGWIWLPCPENDFFALDDEMTGLEEHKERS